MQTLKKIMFSVFLFVFVGFHFASADITDNLSSPQPTGTNITFYCSTGDRVIFFGADGSFIHRQGCSQSSGTPFTSDTAQEINVVECQSNVSITNCDASGSRNYGAFIATENSSGAYVSLIGYTYTTQTGGGTGERVSGIHFFNDSALTGETSVINQLGASVGTTTGSFARCFGRWWGNSCDDWHKMDCGYFKIYSK